MLDTNYIGPKRRSKRDSTRRSGLFFISVSKSFVEIFIRWLSFDRSVEELGSDIVGYIYIYIVDKSREERNKKEKGLRS